MDRIRCPHCGAVNQDVTPQDNCWQCGKPLAASTVEDAAAVPEAAGQVQQLRQSSRPAQPTLEERVAARKAARKRTNAVPFIVVAVLIIILLLLFLALRR